MTTSMESPFLVSAIVSTYKAERFMEGLLKDLLQQTIGNKLEIVVIDSGSPENEGAIVQAYQKKFPGRIIYERTERETVYAAWNRGIQLARGTYITNANTDDRRRNDAYEVLSSYLETHPEIGLVYSDCIITTEPNETFLCNSGRGLFKFEEHDREKLLRGFCYVGPMPMWRKTIHDEVGYFDPDFITSGDLEFWVRASEKFDFKKIPQLLGLYMKRPDSVENSNTVEKSIENQLIQFKYEASRSSYVRNWSKEQLKNQFQAYSECSRLLNSGQLKECIKKIDELLQIIPSDADLLYYKATAFMRQQKQDLALPIFESVLNNNPNHSVTLNNLAVLYWAKGDKKRAISAMEQCVELDTNNLGAKVNLARMYMKSNKNQKAIELLSLTIRMHAFVEEALELLISLHEKDNPTLKKYYQDLLHLKRSKQSTP